VVDMSGIIGLARCVARNRDGATAIEYALLAALIAIAIVGSATLIGAQLTSSFFAVANSFPTP
jgi:pilus assembly protein Flp/PilA